MKKRDVTRLLVLLAVLCTASAYTGAQMGVCGVIAIPIVYVVLILVWLFIQEKGTGT